jgi:hypothetical protein
MTKYIRVYFVFDFMMNIMPGRISDANITFMSDISKSRWDYEDTGVDPQTLGSSISLEYVSSEW